MTTTHLVADNLMEINAIIHDTNTQGYSYLSVSEGPHVCRHAKNTHMNDEFVRFLEEAHVPIIRYFLMRGLWATPRWETQPAGNKNRCITGVYLSIKTIDSLSVKLLDDTVRKFRRDEGLYPM